VHDGGLLTDVSSSGAGQRCSSVGATSLAGSEAPVVASGGQRAIRKRRKRAVTPIMPEKTAGTERLPELDASALAPERRATINLRGTGVLAFDLSQCCLEHVRAIFSLAHVRGGVVHDVSPVADDDSS
jgi:hypothetical protein